MSVDVFGRKLKGGRANGHRGPPGVGFKLTSEGHYDLENKRLENLAPPLQPKDAINLKAVEDIVQKYMAEIIPELRSDLDKIIKAELPQIKKNIQNLQNSRFDGSSSGGAAQASKT